MRQIDADKLEREVTLAYIETCHELTPEQIDAVAKFTARVIGEINAAPTHNTEPTKHGRNIADGRVSRGYENISARIFLCSECGYGFDDIYLCNERDYSIEPNYCPNCGARMDGGENG